MPAQPCGCPGVVNDLKGAHVDGCPYVRETIKTGETMAAWVDRKKREAEAGRSVDPLADNDGTRFRGRPKGDPVPAYTDVAPGESARALFAHWDVHGRTRLGSVLLKFLGNADGRGKGSYAVECNPVDGAEVLAPLGPVGTVVPDEVLEAWEFTAQLKELPATFFAVATPV